MCDSVDPEILRLMCLSFFWAFYAFNGSTDEDMIDREGGKRDLRPL